MGADDLTIAAVGGHRPPPQFEVDGFGWPVHVIGRCHSNGERVLGGRFRSGAHRPEVSLYTMDSRGAATECSPGRKPGVFFRHDVRAYYLAAR